MKLLIQIPCYNEEDHLPKVLSALPREVPGVDRVEWLVVDDGSQDRTVEQAEAGGVDHIVRLPHHQGLAAAFMAGIHASLQAGADVIVTTDADNQYRAECIADLVRPILEGGAEMVIGARPIERVRHFSKTKKCLQRLGSWVVRLASNTQVPDAPSGFRALSREAALQLNVYNHYTYTLETIIQAGQKGIRVTWVPVQTNEDLRPSRLLKSIPSYVRKSILTILRVFVIYKPFLFFMSIGSTLLILGTLIGIRFLFFYFSGQGSGHVQSLILASILIGIGFQNMLVAFIAELLSVNRRLLEESQYERRRDQLNS